MLARQHETEKARISSPTIDSPRRVLVHSLAGTWLFAVTHLVILNLLRTRTYAIHLRVRDAFNLFPSAYHLMTATIIDFVSYYKQRT